MHGSIRRSDVVDIQCLRLRIYTINLLTGPLPSSSPRRIFVSLVLPEALVKRGQRSGLTREKISIRLIAKHNCECLSNEVAKLNLCRFSLYVCSVQSDTIANGHVISYSNWIASSANVKSYFNNKKQSLLVSSKDLIPSLQLRWHVRLPSLLIHYVGVFTESCEHNVIVFSEERWGLL